VCVVSVSPGCFFFLFVGGGGGGGVRTMVLKKKTRWSGAMMWQKKTSNLGLCHGRECGQVKTGKDQGEWKGMSECFVIWNRALAMKCYYLSSGTGLLPPFVWMSFNWSCLDKYNIVRFHRQKNLFNWFHASTVSMQAADDYVTASAYKQQWSCSNSSCRAIQTFRMHSS